MIIGGWRGPGWRVLDAHARNTGEIRHWITSAVVRHGCPVDADDAALVVDELFVNAVTHGPAGGRVLVGYCLRREGARVVVCDGGGPGTPQLHQPSGQAESGRGLRIVDALAARWGHFGVGTARAVWCDLGQPLHVPDSDAWAWLRLVLSLDSLSPPITAPVTTVPAR
jgi:anti-sigma regulatory factor (Ser/Thr protein kinase)